MIIEEIELQNYRNIKSQKLEFSPNVNILYGDNAQGKTNIIEAVRMLSTCRSFRGAADKELILHGDNETECALNANISSVFEKNNRKYTGEIKIYGEKRRELLLNGAKVPSKEFIGNFNSVIFYPEQLGLIKNAPEGRRHFIDLSICQIRPVYISLLSQFSRVLIQRNAVLKSGDTRTLFVWDERFAKLSSLITKTRTEYLKRLSLKAENTAYEISDGKEKLELIYKPSFEKDENALLEELEKNIERDKELGYTSIGAHKDDFETRINGANVKIYGSQGQQRSCVMSFKLAETEILYDVYGEYPLVLLDDVYSELDPFRRAYITEKIKGKQVIITACEKIEFSDNVKAFNIKEGKVL